MESNAKTIDTKELELSVILPVCNEEENITPLVDELIRVLKESGITYEVLAIHRPGKDKTYEKLHALGKKYDRFFPISGSYTFWKGIQKGYQYMLGFSLAQGKIIVQMDSDYQDDPKDLPRFIKKLQEGFDCVVGWKQDRVDPPFYTFTSHVQNTVTRLMTGLTLHDKNCGFKAYTKSAAKSLNLYGMNYRDIPMQLAAHGFKVTEIPITNRKRMGGTSHFSFSNRLLGGTVDFMSSVLLSAISDAPFRVLGGIGLLLLLIGKMILLLFIVWVIFLGGFVDFSWWVVLWIVFPSLAVTVGAVFLVTGIALDFYRSRQPFSVESVEIYGDPKGRVSR